MKKEIITQGPLAQLLWAIIVWNASYIEIMEDITTWLYEDMNYIF